MPISSRELNACQRISTIEMPVLVSCSMDTAFRGSESGPLLKLLDDTLAVAQHSQITSKWIENWKTPDARAESLVNIMHQKISEMEALTKAQVLAPQSEDLKKEIERRKVEWDKCNVELLKGIAFKKIMENETLQKEARTLSTDVAQKDTEIGVMRRKAVDDRLRTESLESQLAEKSKAAELLEMTVKTLTCQLKEKKEKDFVMNISRRRVEPDVQSEEAYRLECDVIFESFRAAFLDTEARYVRFDKEPSETPLKTADSTSLAEAAQSEDWNLSMKSNSDTKPEQGGVVIQTEMSPGKHQVGTKRMRDSEQNEEPNVSVKRSVLRSNVPTAGDGSKEQGSGESEGELEMLTLEQYRDAMSASTEKKKRLQPNVPEIQGDEKLVKKVRNI